MTCEGSMATGRRIRSKRCSRYVYKAKCGRRRLSTGGRLVTLITSWPCLSRRIPLMLDVNVNAAYSSNCRFPRALFQRPTR